MGRTLLVAALVVVGGCGEATTETPSSPSANAAPAPSDDREGDAPTKAGKGLSQTFKEAVGGAPAVNSVNLIPEGATLVVGAEFRAVVNSVLWRAIEPNLGSRAQGQLAAATQCGLSQDKWDRIVIGADPSANDMAIVVEAEGLGTRTTLDCLVKEIGSFTLSADGKRLSDHTGGGFVLSDDVIAFASTRWMDKLEARIGGKGTAAVDGALKGPLARLGPNKKLWLAAMVPSEVAVMGKSFLGAQATDVSAYADLTKGVALHLSAEVDDAKAAQDKVQEQLEGSKSMLQIFGVPSAVVDSLKLTVDGTLLRAEVHATEDEVRAIMKQGAP